MYYFERIYPYEFSTPRELRVGIREYVQEYNTERPHQTYVYLTPYEYFWEEWRPKKHFVASPKPRPSRRAGGLDSDHQ